MSEFLDDLARLLAEPMSRRRAIKITTVTVAAVAFPGWRAGRAPAAALMTCTTERPWNCSCPAHGGLTFQLCCFPGEECKCEPDAAVCAGTCGQPLCKPIPRPGYPAPGGGVCCPPGRECKANFESAACCSKDQKFDAKSGTCKCSSKTTACGPVNCCSKQETCVGSECCPNDQMVGGQCCQGDVVRDTKGSAPYCCPPNTVAAEGGRACCPKIIGNCCETAMETPPIPRPGYAHVCVSGGYAEYAAPPAAKGKTK